MSADLYGEWLRVPAGKRPPNYFDLLGLPPDIEDAEAIDQAARRQAKRVKEHQSEALAGQCSALIQELARARAVLLDPAKRSAYRASLASPSADPWWRNAAASAPPPTVSPTPLPIEAPTAEADHFADLGTPRRRHRATPKTGLLVAFIVGASVVGGGIAAAVIYLKDTGSKHDQAGGPPTHAEPPKHGPGSGAESTLPPKPPFVVESQSPGPMPARPSEPKSFERHTGLVQSLALSPLGRRFLSAGDGGVYEWDLASGKSFHRHGFKVPAAAAVYVAGGRQIACADEGSIVILDTASNETKATFKNPRGNLLCLAADPDGKHVLSGGTDGSIRRWNLETKQPDQIIDAGDMVQIVSLAVSGDGKLVAIGGHDGSVGVWELAGGKRRWKEKRHPQAVPGLAFSPDGARLACAGIDGGIGVWNTDNGKFAAEFPGHRDGALCVAFLKGGAGLVSGGKDKMLRFWGPDSTQAVRSLPAPAPIHALAVSADDSFVLAAGAGGMVRLLPVPELDLEIIAKIEPPTMKLAMPDPSELETATTAMRGKARAQLAGASPEETQAAAERWLARAQGKAEPTARLALFREAIATFVTLGKPPLAFAALELLDRWFEIDLLVETTQALSGLVQSTPAGKQKDLVERGLKLLNEADAESRPDLIAPLLQTLTQAADKAQAPDLVKRVAKAKEQSEQKAKERSRFAELEAKLKTNPDDRDANLDYGLMLCSRGQWKDGLAHLVKGSDAALAKLASQDLAEPKEARPRAALGQGWADAAGKSNQGKAQFLTRAKHWLELAQTGLAGEEKSRIVLKLGEVSAQLSALKPEEKDPPSSPGPVKTPEKPGTIMRRNFNTALNENTFKSQWKPAGEARFVNNLLRLGNDVKLESKFLLADSWRVDLLLTLDGRGATIEVNGQTVTINPDTATMTIAVERRGRQIRSIQARVGGPSEKPVVSDLTEVNQGPSRMTLRVPEKPMLPGGMILRAVTVNGTIKLED